MNTFLAFPLFSNHGAPTMNTDGYILLRQCTTSVSLNLYTSKQLHNHEEIINDLPRWTWRDKRLVHGLFRTGRIGHQCTDHRSTGSYENDPHI